MLTSSETRLLSVLKKTEKKKLEKDNFILHEKTTRMKHFYTTCIQHEIHTTQIIQHKVGILGAVLEALRFYPR